MLMVYGVGTQTKGQRQFCHPKHSPKISMRLVANQSNKNIRPLL